MLTTLKQKRINEVVSKFIIKTIPTISGDPEYDSLNEIIQSLYVNATTLPTTIADGKHGHVSLIMKGTL